VGRNFGSYVTHETKNFICASQRAPSPLGAAALIPQAPSPSDGGGATEALAAVPDPTAMPPHPAAGDPQQAASNTIDDELFFPELPDMLIGLADRLTKVSNGARHEARHLLCSITILAWEGGIPPQSSHNACRQPHFPTTTETSLSESRHCALVRLRILTITILASLT
jgi:hypothetical protein